MLRWGWLDLGRVVSCEGRKLKLEAGGCATIFRFFTPLRCVQNDRMEVAAFGMTGWRWLRSE